MSKNKTHFLFGMQMSRNKKILNHKFNHFRDKDEKIIQCLIHFLTLKMSNFILHYKRKSQLRRINLILNLISELLIERRYNRIFNIIRNKLKFITDYSECSIMFYDNLCNVNQLKKCFFAVII